MKNLKFFRIVILALFIISNFAISTHSQVTWASDFDLMVTKDSKFSDSISATINKFPSFESNQDSLIDSTPITSDISSKHASSEKSSSDLNTKEQAIESISFSHPMAELFNLPSNPTTSTSIDIVVGGDDVVAYKYRLDTNDWSNEILVSEHIRVSDLVLGQHLLEVLGKSNENVWQENPTTYSWQIIEANPIYPMAELLGLPSNPTTSTFIDIIVGGEGIVAYKYRLDTNDWSNEILVNEHILVSDLALGQHLLEVLGKSNENVWQVNPTTYSWAIITSGSGGTSGGGGSSIRWPNYPSIFINDDQDNTNSREVVLTLSAMNMEERYAPLEMIISNEQITDNQEWVDYHTRYNWTLSHGNGSKTVYARFRNQKGISRHVVYDQINLVEGQVLGYREFTDGTLLKTADNEAIYLIKDGAKHVFPHVFVYYSWGYPRDFSTVITVSQDVLDDVPERDPVIFQDGSLFRGVSDFLYSCDETTVFYVECGLVRPIYSTQIYQEIFNDIKWDLIYWVPDDLLYKFTYPLGETISHSNISLGGCANILADGTLIKGGRSDIYEIVNGYRYKVKNLIELKQEYGGRKVNIVSDAVIDHYPVLTERRLAQTEKTLVLGVKEYQNGILVQGSHSSAVYMIRDGKKHVFPHITVYKSHGYPSDFSTVLKISQEELNEVPKGDPITFAERTIFRGVESGTIFKVENDVLRPIYSEDTYQQIYHDPNWRLIDWVPDDFFKKFNYPIGEIIY